jgi:hypothetical protein
MSARGSFALSAHILVGHRSPAAFGQSTTSQRIGMTSAHIDDWPKPCSQGYASGVTPRRWTDPSGPKREAHLAGDETRSSQVVGFMMEFTRLVRSDRRVVRGRCGPRIRHKRWDVWPSVRDHRGARTGLRAHRCGERVRKCVRPRRYRGPDSRRWCAPTGRGHTAPGPQWWYWLRRTRGARWGQTPDARHVEH